MSDKTGGDTIVVALGGNAILPKGASGSFEQQFATTLRSMEAIAQLIEQGHTPIVTHGNGPQVGALLIQSEQSRNVVPQVPIDVAVAMTCGSMGYILTECLQNQLAARGIERRVIALVSRTLVDPNDPAFESPSKPIGPYYQADEARRIEQEQGWTIREDAGRGFRRVVPSPYPIDIIEQETIRRLQEEGCIVIACGGGGVPVAIDADGTLQGIECVVDKDLATMRLALAIGARRLAIITAVERVALDFGTPHALMLDRLTPDEAAIYSKAGQFPAGSMGPKIAAASEFVAADPRNVAIITDIEHLPEALEGRAGTLMVTSAGSVATPRPPHRRHRVDE